MTLYAETEQKVSLNALTNTAGATVDDADVTFTLLDRTQQPVPGFDGLPMPSEGSGGNYSLTIPANAPLVPAQFGVKAVIKASQAGMLKMTKYLPVVIAQGSETCSCTGNGANGQGGCQ